MPVSVGGLGLRSASTHAAAAYLSSLVHTRSTVDQILINFPDRHDLDLPLSVFRAAASSLPPQVVADLMLIPNSGDFSQKHLSYLIDANLQSALLKDVQDVDDKRSSARLLSLTLPQAGAFLNAIPNPSFGLSILPENFHPLSPWPSRLQFSPSMPSLRKGFRHLWRPYHNLRFRIRTHPSP